MSTKPIRYQTELSPTARLKRSAARTLAAVAATLGLWAMIPAPMAHAGPSQVMTEYGGTLDAGGVTKPKKVKATDDDTLVEKGVKIVEDNAMAVIAVVGVLAVIGTWKVIS